MIIKGGSRGRAGDLAAHLQRLDTNERMQILGFCDVAGVTLDQALRELEAHGSAIRCKAALYHASINPRADETLTPAQWAQAVERLEQELGLTGQPRVVVAHVKEGRAHIHALWSRIDLDRLKAIPDSWNYAKHESVARALEREFGLSHIQGAHAKREGAPRPNRTPSPAEMSQSERSGIDPKTRKAELTALWQVSDSGAAFAVAMLSAGYQLAYGDRRAYVVVDMAGEVYALARQLAGVKTAEVKARLTDLPAHAVPDVEQARALQAARNQARKDAPSPMDQQTTPGLSLEEQRRAELVQLQEQKGVAQKSEAQRIETIRQADAQKAEQIAQDEQRKREEVQRIAGLGHDALTAELAKLEATRLQELRDQQERAAAYVAEQERRADQTRREASERMRADTRAAEAGRVREGEIRNASDRYMQALGQHYDVASPYSSLARAAMAEAGEFSRDQEALRRQAAAENDPGKKELLDLRGQIEAKEHFAQVGDRVSRLNEALTAQPEQHWREFAADQAAQAELLREQYRSLAADQERARSETSRQDEQKNAEAQKSEAQKLEANARDDAQKAETMARAAEANRQQEQVAENQKAEAFRQESARQAQTEQAVQAQQRAERQAAEALERAHQPTPALAHESRERQPSARPAEDARERKERDKLAQQHAKQAQALEAKRASEQERKALEERQRAERERLAQYQANRAQLERQRGNAFGLVRER